MSTIERAVEELHKGFRLLNDKIFSGTLPEPAILIQNQGHRTRNILGWCTQQKIWMDKEQTIRKYEINITAEYLDRDVTEIMETMLHEMVHLYCQVNDIKDTSRSGTYHNKRFRDEAERHGLTVEFDKQIGWAYTNLKPETKKTIESFNLDREAFKIKRYTWGVNDNGDSQDNKDDRPRRKRSKNVWECPDCKERIKAKKKINIICGKCMKHFVQVKEDDEEKDDVA
jgi:hypothetical protein